MDRRKHIALLLTAFSKPNDTPEDMKDLIDVYEYALSGITDANIKTTVAAFMQGRVQNHNKAFRPSPAEVAEYARPLQMADDRVEEIKSRVDEQTRQIEYRMPEKAVRDAAVKKWQAMREKVRETDPVRNHKPTAKAKSRVRSQSG